MNRQTQSTPPANSESTSQSSQALSVGCVSFLNSKPLIDGADAALKSPVRFEVPSRLLDLLLEKQVHIALCPVIDYQLSPRPLKVVPVGGICCNGETLTVRVFSKTPLGKVTTVYADTDSHTSVNLMRVIFARKFGLQPEVIALPKNAPMDIRPQCMLLIGDKVVTHEPDRSLYPHQMDLGQAWHDMTGLPFVFATWLALAETELGDLPDRLKKLRETNSHRLDEIVAQYAGKHGWPNNVAHDYLGRLLHYNVDGRELAAIQRFWDEAHALGLIKQNRLMVVWRL